MSLLGSRSVSAATSFQEAGSDSAAALLRAWDGSATPESVAAALYQEWYTQLSRLLRRRLAGDDDAYLPYTINSAIATDPLPRSNLDAELDTTNVLLRVTSSPWRRVRLKGEYRYDDRDNDSPVDTYNWVRVDSAPGDSTENRIYSYTRDTVDLEASARLDKNSLNVSWDDQDDTIAFNVKDGKLAGLSVKQTLKERTTPTLKIVLGTPLTPAPMPPKVVVPTVPVEPQKEPVAYFSFDEKEGTEIKNLAGGQPGAL